MAVIYHDNYYRCQDAIPFEARKKVNYDHPDSLETDLLTEHLKKLKAGESSNVLCMTIVSIIAQKKRFI